MPASSPARARSHRRAHAADDQAASALVNEPVGELAKSLQVGDIVFTRIGAYPFRKVAEATGTWTNHVGSRYVREVLQQGAGVDVGEVQTFQQLLASAPQADVGFWRVWYFGSIAWQRETVTPASMLHSPGLKTVFDGVAS